MVSRIQSHRRENQQLIQKNEDLNLWVQNFLCFAANWISMKTITNKLIGSIQPDEETAMQTSKGTYQATHISFQNI